MKIKKSQSTTLILQKTAPDSLTQSAKLIQRIKNPTQSVITSPPEADVVIFSESKVAQQQRPLAFEELLSPSDRAQQ